MIPPPPRSTLFPYTTLFRSIHVEPGHQEHVLLAVDDSHVAFLVHLADVSGGEEPVGAEYLCGLGRAVPIALHHLGAAHPDLAGRAEGGVLSVVSAQYHFRR